MLWSQVLFYFGLEVGDSTAAPCTEHTPLLLSAPFSGPAMPSFPDLPSGTANLITQVQCRLPLGNGASADSS